MLSPISVFAAVNAPLMGQTCLYSIFELAPSTLVFARAKQTYVPVVADVASKTNTFVACCGFVVASRRIFPRKNAFVAMGTRDPTILKGSPRTADAG